MHRGRSSRTERAVPGSLALPPDDLAVMLTWTPVTIDTARTSPSTCRVPRADVLACQANGMQRPFSPFSVPNGREA